MTSGIVHKRIIRLACRRCRDTGKSDPEANGPHSTCKRIIRLAKSLEQEASDPNKRLRIKKDWFGAGREGVRLGPDIEAGGLVWTPVLWDDEEDPAPHDLQTLKCLSHVLKRRRPVPGVVGGNCRPRDCSGSHAGN